MRIPEPTEEEGAGALAGNYCRCGTHYTAVESIMAYVDQNRKKRESRNERIESMLAKRQNACWARRS